MRIISFGACALVLALSWSCGGGGSSPELRDPIADDLPKLVLQLGDLPDGFAPLAVCEDQNPVPSADGSFAVAFFERFEINSERTACVVSYAYLLPSADEASRAMRSLDETIADLNRPIQEGGECSPFREIDAPRVGEETRILTGDCVSCPADSAQFYWIQFRVGRVLASPRSIGEECLSLSEAIAYATKQKDRIETVLRAKSND